MMTLASVYSSLFQKHFGNLEEYFLSLFVQCGRCLNFSDIGRDDVAAVIDFRVISWGTSRKDGSKCTLVLGVHHGTQEPYPESRKW